MQTGVLVLNFGGPTRSEELTPFLRALFDDVIPYPRLVKRALVPFIASRRAKRVHASYEAIGWSPLTETTRDQAGALQAALGPGAPGVATGMMFTSPTVLDAARELVEAGAEAIIALALFPHYSFSTTGSAFRRVAEAMRELGCADFPVHYITSFHEHPRYVEAVSRTVRAGVDCLGGTGRVHLLFTPHGLPLSYIERGDPYADHVKRGIDRVIANLGWKGPWHLGWQSRIGREEWLGPLTSDVLVQLGRDGVKRVVLVPVSFVGDHIETLYEIDVEYAELAHEAGIEHFGRAPALDLEPAFIECLADLVSVSLAEPDLFWCPRCAHARPITHWRENGSCSRCGFETPDYLRV